MATEDTRLCRQCAEEFTPRHDRQTRSPQQYCGRACYVTAMRASGATRLVHAQRARRRRAQVYARAILEQTFTRLTPRELAIAQAAWQHGYRRGYNRARGVLSPTINSGFIVGETNHCSTPSAPAPRRSRRP